MSSKETDNLIISSPILCPIVGVGASAGGLNAFRQLLTAIPENSGMAFVLVQHLAPDHQSMLADILQKVTNIPVSEIAGDIQVEPNNIYVMPSNKMLLATEKGLQLLPRPPKSNTERLRTIDLFFTSLAKVHQERAIGVVLSGTASDGTNGLKAIKDNGGLTFAQDQASAEYEGMPHSAAKAGVVDFILPPGEIPLKLLEVVNKDFFSDAEVQNVSKQEQNDIKQILSILLTRKGIDFTYYKQATVRRRILRRMVVNKQEETGEYLKLLKEDVLEQDLLFQDMLIPVTSFFRDTNVFEDLCNNVFPTIVLNKTPEETIRIWAAGCSTGQEVYSLAICAKEYFGDSYERIQIFGTDLSEVAIAKARTGIYEETETEDVSQERLQAFFTKKHGQYQLNKSIRDMCVFAHHNFLKDAPFGRMDLITCRNVLIYLERYLQRKALTTFHFALNPHGFLLLGKSENTSSVPHLFAHSDKGIKLFTRKDAARRFMHGTSQRSDQTFIPLYNNSKVDIDRNDVQRTADEILLTKYTPAGVVVNDTMDIMHFRGNTATYLEHPPGKPSHNLLMMAKKGLGFELRRILQKTKGKNIPARKEKIPFSINGRLEHISIEAIPLPDTLEPYYLILFHPDKSNETAEALVSGKYKGSGTTKKDIKDLQIEFLEQELAAAREDLRHVTEDQQASNEQLVSANDQLLSGSEDLQSLNEELETIKEELQSTNEELTVLNHELIGLNELATDARNYAESIVATLYQPLLVLDRHLRVKTANKTFYETFKVTEKETEGVLIYDLGNRQWNIPELRTLLEEVLPEKKQIINFEVSHHFSSIGNRIVLLNALELTREKKEEKLILLSVQDITEVKNSAFEKELLQKKAFQEKLATEKQISDAFKDANAKVRSLFSEAPAIIIVHRGPQHVYELSSKMHQQIIGNRNLLGKPVREAMPELEGTGIYELLDQVYATGEPYVGNEFPVKVDKGNNKLEDAYFNFVYQPTHNSAGEIDGVLVHGMDVTEQVLMRKELEANKNQLQNIFLNAPAAIAIFEGPEHKYILANKAYEKLSNRKAADLLGRSMQDLFPELKGTGTLELFDKVLETGESFSAPEYALMLDLENKGELRQYYFDFSMEALKNSSGEIYGVMAMTYDITEKVEAEKKIKDTETQEAFLLKLSDAIKELIDPVDIQLTACRILGEHVKVNRVLYGEVINEEQIILNNNYVNGVSPIIGTMSAEQFGRNVIDAFKRNEKTITDDITTDPGYTEAEKQSFLSLDVVANAGIGLVKGGRWVATFGMHSNTPRKWTASEILLLEETADRTWAAVVRARAEQALRKSEEKYRSLFNSLDSGFCIIEVLFDDNERPVDYRFLEANDAFEKQTGLIDAVGKTMKELAAGHEQYWFDIYGRIAKSRQAERFENEAKALGIYYEVYAFPVGEPEENKVGVLFKDITERKQGEGKLKRV